MNKILVVIVLVAVSLSGCVDVQEYTGNNAEVAFCYNAANDKPGSITQKQYTEAIAVCDNIEKLEAIHFPLKEMKQKDLTQGTISGSFLLISGSVYGTIEDKMYLVVTYYDPRIKTYKITKFGLEQIEMNTIGKNESAYFSFMVVPVRAPWENYYGYNYDTLSARFYLPEGWSII